MFFFPATDNGRIEREARRRSRYRANKRKRAVVRTTFSFVSIFMLAASAWILREKFTAKHRTNRFSSAYQFHHHPQESRFSSLRRGQANASNESEMRTPQHVQMESESIPKAAPRVQDLQTETTHEGGATEGKAGGASEIQERIVHANSENAATSSSSRTEEEVQIPKAPELLPPAADPNVLKEDDAKEQSALKKKNSEGAKQESGTHDEKELDQSNPDTGKSGKVDEEDIEGHEEDEVDLIEEEEGGRGPVINLQPNRGRNYRKADDEDE